MENTQSIQDKRSISMIRAKRILVISQLIYLIILPANYFHFFEGENFITINACVFGLVTGALFIITFYNIDQNIMSIFKSKVLNLLFYTLLLGSFIYSFNIILN